jgi:hypothetical protein
MHMPKHLIFPMSPGLRQRCSLCPSNVHDCWVFSCLPLLIFMLCRVIFLCFTWLCANRTICACCVNCFWLSWSVSLCQWRGIHSILPTAVFYTARSLRGRDLCICTSRFVKSCYSDDFCIRPRKFGEKNFTMWLGSTGSNKCCRFELCILLGMFRQFDVVLATGFRFCMVIGLCESIKARITKLNYGWSSCTREAVERGRGLVQLLWEAQLLKNQLSHRPPVLLGDRHRPAIFTTNPRSRQVATSFHRFPVM